MVSAEADEKRTRGAAKDMPTNDRARTANGLAEDVEVPSMIFMFHDQPFASGSCHSVPTAILSRMTQSNQPVISRNRLESLLSSARQQHVVIIGDAMLDVYLRGDVDRISPEAPVPVVRVRDRRLALGGAANVAQNVSALGARCDLVAAIGDDIAGSTLRDGLASSTMGARSLVPINRPTTTKTRVMARSQQLLRFDEEEDADLTDSEVEKVLASIDRALPEATAVVFEDYNKGVLVPAVIEHTIEAARAHGLPIIVDPKFRNFFSYRGCTVFKPNRRELENALGAAFDPSNPLSLPATLDRLGAENLLLTLGEQGMALLSSDGEVHRIPTTAREVYDVVGAGDTVTAYLAVMLAAGATTVEAAIVANFAAGVEVGKLGAATVTAAEVLEAYDDYSERSL